MNVHSLVLILINVEAEVSLSPHSCLSDRLLPYPAQNLAALHLLQSRTLRWQKLFSFGVPLSALDRSASDRSAPLAPRRSLISTVLVRFRL
jgi:hypothetical protein